VSKDVLAAAGSVLTNKYAEGYPAKRYYAGCEYVDEVEVIAQDALKKLFGCKYANVQPHSGSQANQAVFLAFAKPNDTILGMSLDCGGHLTHGAKKNLSGLWFNAVSYGVDESGYIDYDNLQKIASETKPKIIIAGFSAYTRVLDWEKFKEIADSVNAILMADIAHIAGLVATGEYPSPIGYADVITSTTHKTLRGPRGGVIMTDNEEYYKKINSALFPGLQGGPLMHIIAAKAVAFQEALQPEFRVYIKNVVKNAKALANRLVENGIDVVSGGTDNHIVLIDLRKFGITGKLLEAEMNRVGLICNKNGVPNDPLPPMQTSGIRIGTPACTTRGFGEEEFIEIADMISEIIKKIVTSENKTIEGSGFEKEIMQKIDAICKTHPIYH
jgi:glycine hydroxymethyltransferase